MCTEYYMISAACEIMNSPQSIPWLYMITEHDYDYIKFGESVIMITIMITQKMYSITINYDYNCNQPQPCIALIVWYNTAHKCYI